MNKENITKAIENYKRFLDILCAEIETAGEKNEAVPTTVFAKKHCAEFNVEWSVLYNQIKMFVASTDDLKISKGPRGGVELKKGMNKISATSGEDVA